MKVFLAAKGGPIVMMRLSFVVFIPLYWGFSPPFFLEKTLKGERN